MIHIGLKYDFLSDKTIYISKSGELKLAHPFLFEKFYTFQTKDSLKLFVSMNFQINILGELLLKNAALMDLRSKNGSISLDLVEQALGFIQ